MGLDTNRTNSNFNLEGWRLAHTEPEVTKTPQFLTLSASLHLALFFALALVSAPLIEKSDLETITIEIEEPKSFTIAQGIPTLKSQGASSAQPAASTSPVFKRTAKTTFKAVPSSIDDIQAPDLDTGALDAKPVNAKLSDDFESDFDFVDKNHDQAIKNEKQNLESLSSKVASEQEKDFSTLDQEAKEEAAELEALQVTLKKKNAAKLNALAAKNNSGSGTGMGSGSGSSGLPNGVRSLDQLKQMPGNPRPQYDRDERLRGDQGEIAFIAYINKEGRPSQFKLLKSTGFRNLDVKTLAALKKWRFYPGQEGWVELPFRWDLKGGVQQDGGTLRRAVSQR